MNTFILILFLANSGDYRSGVAGVTQEFQTESACLIAGKAITTNTKAFVPVWGCYAK